MILAIRPRRLTPIECERLQGFPDYYTALPDASDTARYKALGNSMAVPCMAWIGRRIARVDKKAEPLCWQAERLTEQAKTGVLA